MFEVLNGMLGGVLFLAVIVTTVWCWRAANREAAALAAAELQQDQIHKREGIYYEAV